MGAKTHTITVTYSAAEGLKPSSTADIVLHPGDKITWLTGSGVTRINKVLFYEQQPAYEDPSTTASMGGWAYEDASVEAPPHYAMTGDFLSFGNPPPFFVQATDTEYQGETPPAGVEQSHWYRLWAQTADGEKDFDPKVINRPTGG